MAELTQARPVVIAGHNSPWFRWLAVFLGLVLGLTAAEATLREIAPPSDTKAIAFPGSPRQYGYPANFGGYAGGVRFMTNSSGFRGREFSEASPAKDFSVVVVGDSYAFGYGVEYANSFPAIIERELSSSGTPVKVFDLAMPGYNTAEELATLQEFAPHLHPDLILLSYHPNDIERHAASNENSGETIIQSLNLREHLYLARFLLPQLAGVARWLHIPINSTATAEIADYLENRESWRRNQVTLDQFIALTKALHARLGVVVVPYFVALDKDHPALPAYAAAVDFFRSRGVAATEVFPYVEGMNAGKLWINRFDGHPNALGHTYIAKAAMDLIRDNHLVQPVSARP